MAAQHAQEEQLRSVTLPDSIMAMEPSPPLLTVSSIMRAAEAKVKVDNHGSPKNSSGGQNQITLCDNGRCCHHNTLSQPLREEETIIGGSE